MAEYEMPKRLGRYEIVRELGKGAMGVVYEGLDPNIGRRVAIKTARRELLDGNLADELMERFLREARAAGALNHPNIVTIYDADEQDGIAYIAMEFLEGDDLQDMIGQKRMLEPDEVVEICATVCEALAAAHEQGIVHRDIKPANIMMTSKGQVKVTDFGIARVSDSSLTQDGAMIGTPHYMSPEQFRGRKVDARSDLFSAGVIIYEMLTGEKPFMGEQISTVMQRVINDEPIEPKKLNADVSECLSKVVMKALSKERAKRYQNAQAMAAALRESLKENPDPALTKLDAAAEAAATVVSTQPDAAATVVKGNQADATVRSAARDQTQTGDAAGSTVRQSGAAAVPEPATPPIESAPETPSGETDRGPEAKPAKSKRLVYAAVAAITLVAVIALAFTFLGGKPDTNTPGGGGTGAQPYFKAAEIKLYWADNLDAYDLAVAGDADAAEGCRLGNGTVYLQNKESEEIEEVSVSGGGAWHPFAEEWHGFRAWAGAVGNYEKSDIIDSPPPAKPGDVAHIKCIQLHKDAL